MICRHRGARPAAVRWGLVQGRTVGVEMSYESSYTSRMAITLSVRLDAEAQQALRLLESTGLSRSDAVRRALLDAASRLRDRAALTAEVAALEADEADRAETLALAELMDLLGGEE